MGMSTVAEVVVKRQIRELRAQKRKGTRRNKRKDPKNYIETTLEAFK